MGPTLPQNTPLSRKIGEKFHQKKIRETKPARKTERG
jgi:hypothetical protein